ncbi:hypothetical protein AVEN_229473-1 [Araneus ventricosus]|uniref:Uncharacterized protein n=1 Tax=Araneus ventricosus TaxID=182803 RepID=A0A4Y2IXV2_ARAVE|nr:hypothetical protein AVEN_229473-1 [Araneus ventricosus]
MRSSSRSQMPAISERLDGILLQQWKLISARHYLTFLILPEGGAEHGGVCLEMCESEFDKAIFNCEPLKTMHSSPSTFCGEEFKNINMSSKRELEKFKINKKRRASCLQNCRPGCLKLHYNYKIKEEQLQFPEVHRAGLSQIDIYYRNSEINSMHHDPLYGSGAMFSHIGGLLGYWLGISMFSLLDIIKKLFGKAIILWRRFKEYKSQKTSNYEDLV